MWISIWNYSFFYYKIWIFSPCVNWGTHVPSWSIYGSILCFIKYKYVIYVSVLKGCQSASCWSVCLAFDTACSMCVYLQTYFDPLKACYFNFGIHIFHTFRTVSHLEMQICTRTWLAWMFSEIFFKEIFGLVQQVGPTIIIFPFRIIFSYCKVGN